MAQGDGMERSGGTFDTDLHHTNYTRSPAFALIRPKWKAR